MLDGSRDWYISGDAMKLTSLDSLLLYPRMDTTYNYGAGTTLPLYSNYGVTAPAITITAGGTGVGLSARNTGGGSADSIYLPKGNYTVDTWKEKMNSIPVECYYVRETSGNPKITNAELISQLDALMECGSCEGKTFIKVTADSPNLPAGLIVEAAKY